MTDIDLLYESYILRLRWPVQQSIPYLTLIDISAAGEQRQFVGFDELVEFLSGRSQRNRNADGSSIALQPQSIEQFPQQNAEEISNA